ncbi:MAG: GGDEF domain-containing protein [Lentisphaerae bacterium]|nr:GGDEF domain-containing protein [Lentisphaerota bacterium]
MTGKTVQATSTQTLQQPHTRVQTGPREPYLVVLKGRDTGKHCALDKPDMIIGRSPDADIPINDDLISRFHCAVIQRDGCFYVEDRNSKNGTFVNGRRVARIPVTPESTIQLGRTILHIEYKHRSEVHFEEQLFRQATTDALTHVPNRFYFMRRAAEDLALARRAGHAVALVMFDLDGFKTINDSFGHRAGDHVLRDIAVLIQHLKREEDLLGRYGGDELIIMLRGDTRPVAVRGFCERIRRAVAERPFTFEGRRIAVTVSVGACIRGGSDLELDALITAADRALYAAKERGRNCVEIRGPGQD